jgi:hypothetical protein
MTLLGVRRFHPQKGLDKEIGFPAEVVISYNGPYAADHLTITDAMNFYMNPAEPWFRGVAKMVTNEPEGVGYEWDGVRPEKWRVGFDARRHGDMLLVIALILHP